MKNLWILSEERPKKEVIGQIVRKFASDNDLKIKIKDIIILPVFSDKKFVFRYIIKGINCKKIKDIFVKLVSGKSSFIDFLLFYQEKEPDKDSNPLYAIEETKTDDSESRNTGVYQRCSKFVFIDFYYPKIKKLMLYNLQIPQKIKATETNIFGTRMLLTIGVEILGKKLDDSVMKPFRSIDELIKFKDSMRMPPKGNVPIKIKKEKNKFFISGKLYKAGGLSHDPNIGALTIIALCIRKWEKKKDIVITNHGLKQNHIGRKNKFIIIANKLNIKLQGLKLPKAKIEQPYWHYEVNGEKVASIFVHLAVEAFTNGQIIYENHAGCERGYFIDKKLGPIAIKKYKKGKRSKYKAGNKNAIIYLPDLIICDPKRNEIVNIEGKTYSKRKQGISELKNYTYIEKEYIKPSYRSSRIKRVVVVFGGGKNKIKENKIAFMLNDKGEIILGKNPPEIIKEAVKKLFSLQNK